MGLKEKRNKQKLFYWDFEWYFSFSLLQLSLIRRVDLLRFRISVISLLKVSVVAHLIGRRSISRPLHTQNNTEHQGHSSIHKVQHNKRQSSSYSPQWEQWNKLALDSPLSCTAVLQCTLNLTLLRLLLSYAKLGKTVITVTENRNYFVREGNIQNTNVVTRYRTEPVLSWTLWLEGANDSRLSDRLRTFWNTVLKRTEVMT